MHQALLDFLQTFPELDEPTLQAVARALLVQEFPKGSYLLKTNNIPKACYFVLQGCVRQYKMVDGEEKTVDFFTPKHGTVTSNCYINQTPADYSLVCNVDTLVIVGDASIDANMKEQFPILKEITAKMIEQEWGKTKERFTNFVAASPEERYLHLLEHRPALLQYAPLHQIASYLGMKPESLSRIRKRITQKQ